MVRFFQLISEKIDLPPGLINLVLGDGELGHKISTHPEIDKVAFTGSTQVGKNIVESSARSNLKQVSLELGGKSPIIFFEDTPDIESAVERSFNVMFSHKGEKCSEPTRFYIHEKIYQDVVERLMEKCQSIVCGDSFDPLATQGAQCHRGHFEKVKSYFEIAKQDGASLLCGGDVDPLHRETGGLFIQPTIYGDVGPEMRLSREEIFGPILSINKFKTESEAISMANAGIYGLAAGLYTADISRAHKVASQLDAGMIFINRYGCYDFSSPFGGSKQSGWGKECGIQSIESYTKSKSVWVHMGN